MERIIRNDLLVSGAASHHQKITGMTGKTQGASTDKIHERNETIIISMRKIRLKMK